MYRCVAPGQAAWEMDLLEWLRAVFRVLADPGPEHQQLLETGDKTALVEAEVYRWYNLFFPWSRGVASQSEGAIKPLYDALAMRLDPASPSGISWIYVHESEHETSFA